MSILSKRTQHIEDDIFRLSKKKLLEDVSLELMRSYRDPLGYLLPNVMIMFFVRNDEQSIDRPIDQSPVSPISLEARSSLFSFSNPYKDPHIDEAEYRRQLVDHLTGIADRFGCRTTDDVKIMFGSIWKFHD